MTTGYTAPLGAPTWIDLATSDLGRAQDFYGTIFGWTFESAGPEYGGYVTAAKDGSPVAGLMANKNAPDAWTTYLRAADIHATVKAATAAGGTSCVEPMEIPQKGWMALGTDPSGAPYGLWQPTGHRGFEVVGVHGTPAWHQLTTRDFVNAIEFYRTVFGWEVQAEADTDEFRYSTAIFGGEPLLGVMDGSAIPTDVSPQWTVFFASDDVDKTLQTVTDLGGSVVRAAEDTPYGRLAAATDPTGAAFNLAG